MQEAFHLGGWGMYPTTIIGLVLVAVAIQYARDPQARYRRIVRTLAVLTSFSSLLGFTTGVLKTFLSVGPDHTPPDCFHLVVTGVGESLHNIALGLCMLVCAWIAVAIGTARSQASASPEDTHAP
jgi:hypothetical protein